MHHDFVGRYRLHISLCSPSVQQQQQGAPPIRPSKASSKGAISPYDFFDVSTQLGLTGAACGIAAKQISRSIALRYSRNEQSETFVALDPRLGRISVQSFPESCAVGMKASRPESVPSASASPSVKNFLSSSASPWRSRFTKSSSFIVDDNEGELHGGQPTEVVFGIVHLFREPHAMVCSSGTQEGSTDEEPQTVPLVALEDDSASILAILGLPSQMTAADFLGWIEPALESIEKIRMIREENSANRLTVLMRFRDPVDAEEFYKQYAGQSLPFVQHSRTSYDLSFSPSTSSSHLPKSVSTASLGPQRHSAQIVYVTQVTVSASSSLPFAYPQLANSDPWPLLPSDHPSDQSAAASARGEAASAEGIPDIVDDTPAARLALSLANELPTCPVCLERMDSSITGVMTVSCQHSFHCECLSRWGDGRCPVCRYSQSRAAKRNPSSIFDSARRQLHAQAAHYGSSVGDPNELSETVEEPEDFHETGNDCAATQCTVCGTTDDLWVCLICATVGCGRYKKGCAKRHFVESGHLYSLEVETSRVWDYVNDGYIHRLIQNRTDGKLVELPSSTSMAHATPSRSNRPRRRRRRHHRRRRHSRESSTPTAESQALAAGTSRRAASPFDDDNDEYDSDEDDNRGVDSASDADGEEFFKTGGKLRGSDAKLEAISLEYQYLLLSQLESQRSYYEGQVRRVQAELEEARSQWQLSSVSAEKELELEVERASWVDKIARSEEREKAIAARCKRAVETMSKLSRDLDAERALSKGLLERLQTSQEEARRRDREALELRRKCQDQEEQLRDLMFALETQHKIQQAEQHHQHQQTPTADGNPGGNLLLEARGGDIIIQKSGGRSRRSQTRSIKSHGNTSELPPPPSPPPVTSGKDGGDEEHGEEQSSNSTKATKLNKKKNNKKKKKKKKGKESKGAAAAEDPDAAVGSSDDGHDDDEIDDGFEGAPEKREQWVATY